MIGDSIRRIGFWTIDFLKGSPVRIRMKHIKEVKAHGHSDENDLKSILEHAINTVPYYHNIEKAKIEAFPVVSKVIYRNDYDSFRSSSFSNMDSLTKIYTSGSTGTPFMALQEKEKSYWHQAALIDLNNSIGWKLGNRYAFFRVWGLGHQSQRLKQLIENMVPISVIGFNEKEQEKTRQLLLSDKHLHIILGYSSALESFAKYLSKYKTENENYGISLIIADSDNLSIEGWNLLEEIFKCPVLNRYGTNENGILALTKPEDRRMFVNYPQFYVEVLKFDSDESVAPGESGRIVITDLYNKAFPFIRYDTGDIGIASEFVGNECVVIDSLQGRMATSLRKTDGERVAETTVVAYFKKMPAIGRFQVIQKGNNRYQVLLENTDADLDLKIIACATECFGEDAVINIVHVSQIEQGKNGKYKITRYEVND